MPTLRNHPFPVRAHLDRTVVLTFAVPQGEAATLLPPPLQIDSFDEAHAFLAVALVETRQLRPAGMPSWLGNDFILIGYRLLTRYVDRRGKRLRGLYILRSVTNRRRMQLLGRLFTRYDYLTEAIDAENKDETLIYSSRNFLLKITEPNLSSNDPRIGDVSPIGALPPTSEPSPSLLPTGSPFPDWSVARRYTGPMPFTFSYLPKSSQVLIVEGVRGQWRPRPARVLDYRFDFLPALGFSELRLASAFTIEDVPYRWKAGRTEKWNANLVPE